jgi:hypothetical protein
MKYTEMRKLKLKYNEVSFPKKRKPFTDVYIIFYPKQQYLCNRWPGSQKLTLGTVVYSHN